MKRLLRGFLLFYKRFVSDGIHSTCIYTPTCSMYTLDAVERYGAARGVLMGMARIARCNPFSRGGYDPVKENLKGIAKWTL